MHAQQSQQMHRQSSPLKITKFKVPVRLNSQSFSLPSANRYFAKVQTNHKLLSSSLPANQTKQTQQTETNLHQISRSLSLSFSRKQVPHGAGTGLQKVVTLPKINSKSIPLGDSEIIRSELGVLNVVGILREKQLLEERQERQKGGRVRVTSLIEEDYEFHHEHETEQQGENRVDGEVVEQKPYDYYHSYLMREEGRLYRAKHFKLKHKADWQITLGNII